MRRSLHIPMMTGDHHSTGTRLFAFFDKIDFMQPFPGIGCLQLIGEDIVSYTSSIDNRVGRENIL